MSKRKPATASKRARGAKIAARPQRNARAQRNKQDFVRSPKDNPLRSVAAGSAESRRELRDDSKQDSKQEAPTIENQAARLKDSFSHDVRDNNPKRRFDFSLATANMQAYQAKLLEVAQANMQFALEFGQRLATIRSPFEFFTVVAEFTSRRMDLFRQHSKELAAYTLSRIDASRELAALPGR